MSLTINATLGDEFANSYVDVAFADDYFTNHWDSIKSDQWAALGTPAKTTLLIGACRVIETMRFTQRTLPGHLHLYYDMRTGMVRQLLLRKEPIRYFPWQHLQFPRNIDVRTTDGTVYIPDSIQMAQCEQTIYTLNFDETAMANRIQGVIADQLELGRSQIRLQQQYAQDGSSVAPLALEMARPYLLKDGQRMRRA